MNAQNRKIPEHQAIYSRIRDAILFGELVPGQAVTIQGLADMIGAGMTPAREAIRRLTSEGALETLGNRRIVVPRLDAGQVEELAYARLAIEPKLAEMAANAGTLQLVAELTAIDAELDGAIATGSVGAYLRHNHRFHFRLYRAAGTTILTDLARSLWLRSGPSLRVVCGRFGTANLPDMHDQALAGLRAGDAAAVRSAMAEDIAQGMDQVRRALADDGD